jgi:hypothetical protein
MVMVFQEKFQPVVGNLWFIKKAIALIILVLMLAVIFSGRNNYLNSGSSTTTNGSVGDSVVPIRY